MNVHLIRGGKSPPLLAGPRSTPRARRKTCTLAHVVQKSIEVVDYRARCSDLICLDWGTFFLAWLGSSQCTRVKPRRKGGVSALLAGRRGRGSRGNDFQVSANVKQFDFAGTADLEICVG